MILAPLSPGQDIPGPLLSELTALYASNSAFHRLTGDFPDPDDIRPHQIAAALTGELAVPGAEVLLARAGDGRLLGLAITLARHPDPADPDPWIGLLLVHGAEHGKGYGRALAERLEDRLRARGAAAVRLAVLDNNPAGLAFWTSLGYGLLDRRADRALGRPCAVLRKPLRTLRPAARIAVVDPDGAVLLFRHDNAEAGIHWALPGGGLEAGEGPREGALRELAEETGWTDLSPGTLLCTWESDLARAGVPVRQHEHVYVTRGPRREPAGADLAAEGVLAWHWWSPRELARAREPVWPRGLARMLAAWASAGDR
ncbi:bifunctional GNAT family N-acetyltransferase/NUDIX hydrolase [Streptomyces sp. F-1]|uniref:bifunctional GNAT family N-acetyltransferase/NUDIX hydrolase n=1 Tax=Streptomyces sp. F-1 TaxID=463642 RepID=UPI00085C093C|nr:bifunctional GNAT family N-acetyltransferase/NUDIX hydrolase [Streptomyces sp. F-1]SFY47045.1 RNA pyrophosphohydrolase [Streptomyces sp. F-1]